MPATLIIFVILSFVAAHAEGDYQFFSSLQMAANKAAAI